MISHLFIFGNRNAGSATNVSATAAFRTIWAGVSSVLLLLVLSWQTTRLNAAERVWPFAPPKRIAPPQVQQADWVRNPVDAFILARLEANQLQPSLEASRQTLLRRIYFDLVGVPPTTREAETFLTADDPRA